MPQKHQIVRCFKCKTFQVHLVKKKPKWECKICSEKQSTKKVFLHSECAKDCRLMVQELNLKYSELNEEYFSEENNAEEKPNENDNSMLAKYLVNPAKTFNEKQSVHYHNDQPFETKLCENTCLSKKIPITQNKEKTSLLKNTIFETNSELDLEI